MAAVLVLDRFTPDDTEAIRRLADDVERATGVAPFGETTWLGLADGGSRNDIGFLLPASDGSARGYAHVALHHDRAWSLEVAAADDAVADRHALVRAALRAVAERGGGRVTMWVHHPTADDDRIVQELGFVRERDLLQMRVALPLDERPRWPEGVTVRPFDAADAEAWLAVNNRAFAGHPEQGGWDVATLQRRIEEPWFEPAGFLLAFDSDGLAGFCWTKIHPAHPPAEPDVLGEIYVIGVDPSRQGLGLGRALVVGGLESLVLRGARVGMLFVDAAETVAVGLYTSLGFTTSRLDRAYRNDVAPDPAT